MRELSLPITCLSCSMKDDDEEFNQVFFEFYKQEDDLIVLQCPKCKTQIQYDDVEAEAIKIMKWLYEADHKLYVKIVKEYFKPLLEPLYCGDEE